MTFLIFLLRNRKYAFKDKDLDDQEDIKSEINEDEERLEVLTKEMMKTKQRQASIRDAMHEQMNILLAVAARVGVDTQHDDAEDASRNVSL